MKQTAIWHSAAFNDVLRTSVMTLKHLGPNIITLRVYYI